MYLSSSPKGCGRWVSHVPASLPSIGLQHSAVSELRWDGGFPTPYSTTDGHTSSGFPSIFIFISVSLSLVHSIIG